MAKKIIILEKLDNGRFKYALWASVPATRQSFYANPNAISSWTGASAQENSDIASGAVVEKTDVLAIDGQTVNQAMASLRSIWQAYQDQITAYNPWNKYGSFWDGTSWTAGGVN